MYNVTGIASNSTGYLAFVKAVNTQITMGWLGILLVLLITIISLIAFLWSSRDAGASIMGSSFIMFVMTLLFIALEMVPPKMFFFSIVVLSGSVALRVMNR